MTECPRCSGEIWNNIEKKRSGKMKPTGPDYACRDKDGCGWVKWPPKGQQNRGGGQGGGNGASAGDRGSKGPSRPLAPLYRDCVRVAHKVLAELVPGALAADIVAAAATLFIAATRDGTPLVEPPKPPPKPAVSEHEPEYEDYDENVGF